MLSRLPTGINKNNPRVKNIFSNGTVSPVLTGFLYF